MARLNERPATGFRILIVDDSAQLRRSTARLLARRGHDTREATDGPQAVRRAARWQPHLILLDWYLADTTAEELLPHLRAAAPQARVLLVSGYASDLPGEELARRLGASGFHDKGSGASALLELVEAIVAGSVR